MTIKTNTAPGKPFSHRKILLSLLPYWTPLIPPQGIARIKVFLQEYGYSVRTIDANLDKKITQLYDRYCNTLRELVPESNRGNFYNIRNDVWREHAMAHLHYEDETKYLELVKILIDKIFYCHVADTDVLKLNNILDEYYRRLEEYFLGWLEKEKPGVVGLSVFRDTLASSMFIFKLVKRRYPQIKTVMGGAIFSVQLIPGTPNMDYFLEKTEKYIDKIIIGNGENLLLEYLQGELPDSQRVYTLKDSKRKKLSFSDLKVPDLSDFDDEYYHYQAAQGSGSCPYQCSFCNVASFYGEYKSKAPKQLVQEMIQLYKRYRSQLFFMLDALLNYILTDLSNELINTGISLYYDGYLRVDARLCNPDNVYLWRKGGFYRARIGVETGSQRVLDLMDKGITVEDIKSTISNLANAGIKTTTYIVIGHPGETDDDFRQTLDLLEELKNDIWEAECNPFTYVYSGQGKNDEWAEKRKLLYPPWAKEMLVTNTWFVDDYPPREVMYERTYRFAEHCRKLGISTPWNMHSINQSDERWKKLHKNAVPPLLALIDKEKYIDESRHLLPLLVARSVDMEEEEFDF